MRRVPLLAAAAAVIALAGAGSAEASYPVIYDFNAGLQAQAQHPNSSPPGANDWSCRPSKAHPRPVVLVHGLFANQTDEWQTFSPLLANRGFCVFSLTYGTKPDVVFPGYQPGGVTTIEASAAQLARFVKKVRKKTKAKRVDIVGHSEGSLMPAYYVKFLGGRKRVRHYIGITTLWHGTNLAGAATLEQLGRSYGMSAAVEQPITQYCESCAEFLTGSEFLTKLRAGGLTVGKVKYTSIVTRNDELVIPYTSGIESAPNMTNIVVQDQCPLDQADHIAMVADPVVAQDMLNVLDPAHAAKVPCTLVLPETGAPGYQGPPR
jgi:triacylglycerol esterase/lipase EstA (alpha/beta hydrolase family)